MTTLEITIASLNRQGIFVSFMQLEIGTVPVISCLLQQRVPGACKGIGYAKGPDLETALAAAISDSLSPKTFDTRRLDGAITRARLGSVTLEELE